MVRYNFALLESIENGEVLVRNKCSLRRIKQVSLICTYFELNYIIVIQKI